MEDSMAAGAISQGLSFLGLVLRGFKYSTKMLESLLSFIFHLFNRLRQVYFGATSRDPSAVPQLTQLHEMVYEVYNPLPKEKPDVEVIFCHGLDLSQQKDVYKTTWMSYDNSHLWLKTWLVEEFPNARILLISYDSSTMRSNDAGNLGMYCTAENLVHALTSDQVRVGQAGCPVVLVGHCVGGLVLKELCVSVAYMLTRESPEFPGFDRIDDLFSNLRGMFFYGTPHLGSLLGNELHNPGALAAQIQILKASTSRRNEGFLKLKTRYKWATYGIGEQRKTFVGILEKSVYVVEEASSRAYMDSYYSAPADHLNVCKPREKHDSAFQKLADFLHQVQEIGALQGGLADNGGSYPESIIDLKGRVSQVCNMLAKPNAQKVFLVGLSGIGKTTLAEQVFNDMRPNFGVACFVSLQSIEDHSNIKQQVLRKIKDALDVGRRGAIGNHLNVFDYLKAKKVLMILDNVESQEQLDALFIKTWLDGSSRLIVTTTNSRLGSLSNTFEVPYLSSGESRKMFLNYAFEGKEGPQNVKMLIDKVIRKCDGFPLSLKILGSYVGHEKDNDKSRLWLELIEKMDQAVEVVDGDVDYKLWARLRPCYDALGPTEKELFLDIATTFSGFSFSMVECIWNGCRDFPFTAWTNLKKRSLANENKDGKIWMHTQIRDLGRSIACPRNTTLDKWRRIAETNSAKELIGNYKGFVETQGLKLKNVQHETLLLSKSTFIKFVHLQYLILEGVEVIGENVIQLPASLAYLSWSSCSFTACPVDFSNLERLTVLDLSYCTAMKSLPSSLEEATKLTWLELKGCRSLSDVGVFKFRHLKYLGMNGTSLTTLPNNLGKSKDLEYLQAKMTQLRKVPKYINGLRMLVSIDFRQTNVKALPEAIGNLKCLKTLNLRESLMSSLPESVGELDELEVLDLNWTPLESLPESVCKLRSLKELCLYGTKISTLPDGIRELVALERLELLRSGLRGVPETVSRLLQLGSFTGRLDLRENCLEHLASLKFLKSLDLDVGVLGEEQALALGDEQSQTRMQSLISPLFSLLALTKLHLFGTNCSETWLPPLFRALQQIPSLSVLSLSDFNLVEVMPYELGTLPTVKMLQILHCERLRELPESLGNLCRLTRLDLCYLPRLFRLPESLGVSPSLSSLRITNCKRVESMPRSSGHVSPILAKECSSSQGNTSERQLPCQLEDLSLFTDSWKVLECFLEWWTDHASSQELIYIVNCEDMEKVIKEGATEEREGGYVLDSNVAGALLRGRNLNQLRQSDSGVEGASVPSTCHPPGNHYTGLQSIFIRCVGFLHWRDAHNHCSGLQSVCQRCDLHTADVRVVDRPEKQRRQRSETAESEVDSEIEEDEMDGEIEEDEVDSAIEKNEVCSEMEEDNADNEMNEDETDRWRNSRQS